jgi:hypothetical protein
LVELEPLRTGVTGEAAVREVLRRLADDDARLDARELDRLPEHARDQLRTLEHLHTQQTRRPLEPIAEDGGAQGWSCVPGEPSLLPCEGRAPGQAG